MRVQLVTVFLAACATAQPDRGPRSEPLDVRSDTPGECEPIEFTLASPAVRDAVLRVGVSPTGRAEQVALIRSTGDVEEDALALATVREIFHCSNALTREAKRIVEEYPVHFHPVDPPTVDASCIVPDDLPYPGQEAPLELRVALDETGLVIHAWSVSDFQPWALSVILDSIHRRCRFTPARVGGRGVTYVARYTYRFHERPKHFR
jgi:hypothetical protein